MSLITERQEDKVRLNGYQPVKKDPAQRDGQGI
jgi:hypothetical protein